MLLIQCLLLFLGSTWPLWDHNAVLLRKLTSLHIFCTSSSLPAAATSVLLHTMPLFLLTLMAAVTCSSLKTGACLQINLKSYNNDRETARPIVSCLAHLQPAASVACASKAGRYMACEGLHTAKVCL